MTGFLRKCCGICKHFAYDLDSDETMMNQECSYKNEKVFNRDDCCEDFEISKYGNHLLVLHDAVLVDNDFNNSENDSIIRTMTCGELIKSLSQFPKDKPVKILANGSDYDDDFPEPEDIDSIGYPLEHIDDEYDEEGNPVLEENTSDVCIFTKDYVVMIVMNGV